MVYTFEAKKDFSIQGALVLEGEHVKATRMLYNTLAGTHEMYEVELGYGRRFVILRDQIQWFTNDEDDSKLFIFKGIHF